jgi:RNA polymerase sigma-54 factor
MSISAKLEMRQGQSLVMTPQLLQAIKLLQLSHLDLQAFVEAEIERNPLLERSEGDGGDVDGFEEFGEGDGGIGGGGLDAGEDAGERGGHGAPGGGDGGGG